MPTEEQREMIFALKVGDAVELYRAREFHVVAAIKEAITAMAIAGERIPFDVIRFAFYNPKRSGPQS